MEDISKYVEDLLYRHQCVIIPDFGAFISNRKPAEIAKNKTFSPPSKALTFNSRLISNDGLLIKHVSEVEKISYELAQLKVRQSVNKWNARLDAGENVKFANIGFLEKQGEGRVEFTPSDNVNLLTDSFGMSSFVPQEANTDKKDIKQEPAGELPEVLNTGEATKKIAKTTKENNKKKSKGYLKYAAIVVIGLLAIGYGAFSLSNSPSKQDNAVADAQATQKKIETHISEATFLKETPLELPSIALNVVKGEENKVVNTEEKTTTKEEPKTEEKQEASASKTEEKQPKATENTKKEDKKETKKKKEEAKKKETPKTKSVDDFDIPNTNLKYHVIAGAFSSKGNAAMKAKQLRKQGYKAFIVGQNSRGLYQVSYQSFKTQAEADKFSKNIKENKKLDSWVLKTE